MSDSYDELMEILWEANGLSAPNPDCKSTAVCVITARDFDAHRLTRKGLQKFSEDYCWAAGLDVTEPYKVTAPPTSDAYELRGTPRDCQNGSSVPGLGGSNR